MNIADTSGRKAEAVAAQYLQAKGYNIIDQNWRHPSAEIDIIAVKGRVAVCFEVKYRRSATQGTGFDYITNAKLVQMRKAASIWVQTRGWRGQILLGACEVSGSGFDVTGCITDLS